MAEEVKHPIIQQKGSFVSYSSLLEQNYVSYFLWALRAYLNLMFSEFHSTLIYQNKWTIYHSTTQSTNDPTQTHFFVPLLFYKERIDAMHFDTWHGTHTIILYLFCLFCIFLLETGLCCVWRCVDRLFLTDTFVFVFCWILFNLYFTHGCRYLCTETLPAFMRVPSGRKVSLTLWYFLFDFLKVQAMG